MTAGEAAPLITSIATLLGVIINGFISARNGRKLTVVKEQTDGLVKASAATNKALGTAEGTAIGLAQGRAENGKKGTRQ
jgi:hypothetical protein